MKTWPNDPRVVGQPLPRLDGPDKVTGKAKFAYDVLPEGWLYGMILRAPFAAAKVSGIDLEPARQVPGVEAVIAVRETPYRVRYYGDELAAVAGKTKQACWDALQKIKISARVLPHVVDELETVHADAPEVFEGSGNVGQAGISQDGDPEKAFSRAAHTVAGQYTTQVQLHHSLETHGNTVQFDGRQCLAWASTQGVFSVRDGLAGALDVPQSDVRVITEVMGGGFGSKFGAGVEGVVAARLSEAAGGRPVKLMLTRMDEALAVGNRPSSFQQVRLAADAEGTITGYDLDGFGCAGYAGGASSEGGGGGARFQANYLYRAPNRRVKMGSVAINGGGGRAYRAPGHPQGSFTMEGLMDDMALKLGMDPVAFRIKNDPFPIRRKQWAIGMERFGWQARYRPPGSSEGPVKTGVGCGGARWGVGGRGTRAAITINPDGSVEVRCGTQDIGTGTRTYVSMIAAEVFGIPMERITSLIGDSRYPPSGGSGGSTTAPSVAPAIFDASTKALDALKAETGLETIDADNWDRACRLLGTTPLEVQGAWREGLSERGVGGVQFAEVEVDTETGFVRVNKILCLQDCGLVLNALTARSQINGGVIGGIGYALYEERVMDDQTGVVLNPNFETYKLPGFADVPEIDAVLMNFPKRGVIGIGEPVTIPTASAIANAVANAIGVRIFDLPITPDRVLSALGQTPGDIHQQRRDALARTFNRYEEVAAADAETDMFEALV
ncbi:MAG: xanthine dehydrogenase family protein molybdopterin-binding subunit [Opitutales bacterium]